MVDADRNARDCGRDGGGVAAMVLLFRLRLQRPLGHSTASAQRGSSSGPTKDGRGTLEEVAGLGEFHASEELILNDEMICRIKKNEMICFLHGIGMSQMLLNVTSMDWIERRMEDSAGVDPLVRLFASILHLSSTQAFVFTVGFGYTRVSFRTAQ